MNIRIVSSKDEVPELDPKEIVIHLAIPIRRPCPLEAD